MKTKEVNGSCNLQLKQSTPREAVVTTKPEIRDGWLHVLS
jgi:hypothetical protein